MALAIRVGMAVLLMIGLAVLILGNWRLSQGQEWRQVSDWNWWLAPGPEPDLRFGRCVAASRDLTMGIRITEYGKDVHEQFCRRSGTAEVFERASELSGKYVKADGIAKGHRLSFADIQDTPPENTELLRVFVKVPEGRATCLEAKDQLLLFQVNEQKQKLIPDPKQHPEGLEVLEVSQPDDTGHSLVTVALPSKCLRNAILLSQGEWTPILLNPDRPGTCLKLTAQTPSQTGAEKE